MTWRIGISSGACTCRPILDVIPTLRDSGAVGVELGTPPGHFNPWEECEVLAVRERLREAGLEPVSIHAPFGGLLDLAEPNPHHRHAAIGAILTAAAAIRTIGGRLVVVHPSDLERNGHDVSARLADCARSLALLAENCRQGGLTLAIESPLPHLIGGHPDEFAWLLSRVDPSARVCLDTGHTALGGHWRRFVKVAGARLTHVHLNDNRGQWDDHLPPGDGTINWADVVHSLEEVEFEGWLMLELRCPDGDATTDFRRAVERTGELFERGGLKA